MDEAQVVECMALIAHHEATKVAEPRVEALDLPAATIAPERTPILRFGAYSPAPMGRDHLDAQRGQRHVKPIRVVGTIPDQAPWEGIDEAGVKGWRDEGHLVRRI